MSNQAFINAVKDGAIKGWQIHKILPSVSIAQAILESAWGQSELAKKGNNLFGVKGEHNGQSVTINTSEYVDGKWIKVDAEFRKYKDWNESIEDHGAFFTSTDWREKNYAKVIGETDYRKATQALKEAGYATDPSYNNKLNNIIETYNLNQYDPKGATMSKSIIIDPGHGGSDPGARGFGVNEKDWNLRISLYQYKRLKELGANVAITRTTDHTLDSVPRTNLIKGKYDFCISNHWNAFNGTARGVETIYNYQQPRAFADDLANALVKVTSIPLRRVFQRKNDEGTNYYFMHRLTGGVNTVIIEYGFIDNKVDHDWYKNETNFYKAAEAVIEVVCKHVGIAYKHGSNVTPPKTTPAPVHKSVDQLAQEVIKGLHGTGEARKKRLGAQYAEVQARVNQILAPNAKPKPKPQKTIDQLAKEVIDGKHGNGEARKKSLGSQYNAVQKRVDEILTPKQKLKPNDTIAREVVQGLWGNGSDRKARLERAGYNYTTIQNLVNRMF